MNLLSFCSNWSKFCSLSDDLISFYIGGGNDSGRVFSCIYVPIHPKFPCVSIMSFIFHLFIYFQFIQRYIFFIYVSFRYLFVLIIIIIIIIIVWYSFV